MTPKEILLKAADLMELHGRAKGALFGTNGCICPLGAIALAEFPATAKPIHTARIMGHLDRGGVDELYDLLRGSQATQVFACFLRSKLVDASVATIFSWNDLTFIEKSLYKRPQSTSDVAKALRECASRQGS